MLRDWIAGLTGAGILLAVALAVTPEGMGKRMVRFGGGLVLLITLCRPFVAGIPLSLGHPGAALTVGVEAGEESAIQLQRQLIEERLSAYILSKGRNMGLDLTVTAEAQLQNGAVTPVGVGVVVRGGAAATDVEALTRWIEAQCGIPANRQSWSLR